MRAPWPSWTLAVTALGLGCTAGEDRPPPAQTERRAALEQVSGDVRIKRAAGDDWASAGDGMPLYESDRVRTAKGASAVVRFVNGSSLVLNEDALIGIADGKARPGADHTDVTVVKGRVDAELQDPLNQTISVGTPSATVRAGREIVFQ